VPEEPVRIAPILLLATFLAACTTPAPADAPRRARAAAASPTEFLLDSAAADFRTHPPRPSAFRNVRYGQSIGADGVVSHRLCGEYQVARTDAAPEWAAFATLKTSGYEQWLGDTAYCRGEIQWVPGDLSAELQRRFDATR
jgi:hypothetical protein